MGFCFSALNTSRFFAGNSFLLLRMRILHSIAHIHDEISGPSASVPALASTQSLALKQDVDLVCQGAGRSVQGVRVLAKPEFRLWSGYSFSPSALWFVALAGARYDVHHFHGLWRAINCFPSLVRSQKSVLVCSPRGSLFSAALNQKALLKKLFWPLQASALHRAQLLHATSIEEMEVLRSLGFRQDIAVVSNGVGGMPRFDSVLKRKAVLYLGRLHEGKGVDRLIRCWALSGANESGFKLLLAGHGAPSYIQYLKAVVRSHKLSNVEFVGPVFGESKWKLLAECSLLALLSDSENFGMSVAEALLAGTPVLVGSGAPWKVASEKGFGWWVNTATDSPPADALRQATCMDMGSLAAMGSLGRSWAENELSWVAVSQKMLDAYRYALGLTSRPSFIF